MGKVPETAENKALKAFLSMAECDIIDMDRTLDILNMKRKIQYAKTVHNHEIHHTEASGWFTYVDDSNSPKGLKKIRRCSEESFWEALADWYDTRCTSDATLEQVFEKWLAWKETPKNKSTIKRIKASWKAYYQGEPLSQELLSKPLAKVTSLELRQWAESLLKKHYPADQKKFSRIFSIANQCFKYAADEDIAIIPENTWTKARDKINKDLIVTNPVATDESQVFTDEERLRLRKMVYEDMERYRKQPTSAGLQILFLFETGLRIGECCGLKWDDIKDNRLYIRRQADNDGVREWTKTTSGYRDIPLTRAARKILEDVAAYNEAHGFTAEWIFQSSNPKYDYRLSYHAAWHKIRKLCLRMDSTIKSPHKCRKTCISALLDSPDINNRTVQRFAGHRELSTTYNYYNFDRKSKDEQAEAIDRALTL